MQARTSSDQLPASGYPVGFAGLEVQGADVVLHCADPRLLPRWTVARQQLMVAGWPVLMESMAGPAVRYGHADEALCTHYAQALRPALALLRPVVADQISIALISHWGCGGVAAELKQQQASLPDLTELALQLECLERAAGTLAVSVAEATGRTAWVVTGIEPTPPYYAVQSIAPGPIAWATDDGAGVILPHDTRFGATSH